MSKYMFSFAFFSPLNSRLYELNKPLTEPLVVNYSSNAPQCRDEGRRWTLLVL